MRGAVLARQSRPGPSCGIFGAICQERSGRDNPRSKLPERTFETFLGCKCSTSSPWERGTEHKIRNYVEKTATFPFMVRPPEVWESICYTPAQHSLCGIPARRSRRTPRSSPMALPHDRESLKFLWKTGLHA